MNIVLMRVELGQNNYISCYGKEETICDIIRNKENENIDIGTLKLALQEA